MDKRPSESFRRGSFRWLLLIALGGLIALAAWWCLPPKLDLRRLAPFFAGFMRVSGSRLIVQGAPDGQLIRVLIACFDVETGHQYWSADVPGLVRPDPIITQDGMIVYYKWSGNLTVATVANVRDDVEIWSSTPIGNCSGEEISIAVTGSRVYVMGPVNPGISFIKWLPPGPTACAVYNLGTGKLIAKQSFGRQFVFGGVPVADAQVIYFASDVGGLYAYDMGSHRMLWSHAGGPYGAICAPPHLLPAAVVFVSNEGIVTGVERNTGLILWRTSVGVDCSFTQGWKERYIVGPTLLIPYDDERHNRGGHIAGLIGVDVQDGHVQFRYESFDNPPYIVPLNSRLALVFVANHLFRLSVPSGSLRHIVDLPEDLQYGPCVLATSSSAPHRSLVMARADGWVYTLNLDPLDRFLQ